MDTIEFLKTTELFNCLDEGEIAAITSRIKTKSVPKNTQVIMVGDTSSTLYIIKEGSVSVVARNEGDYFIDPPNRRYIWRTFLI
jgi:CRP/FNR family transcriptional regulator, cyclic AMP receptor protein